LAGGNLRAFKKLFEKPKEVPSEVAQEIQVLEVEERRMPEAIEVEPIYIKSFELKDSAALQDARDELQRGNILIIDMSALLSQDPMEVRQTVEQLKVISKKVGGDIGKLSDSKIIATPKFVKIQFRKAA
jgi:SepF-like predicted cell division protein (DUF552 family)